NPSKGQTTFKYQLPKATNVCLTVYNVAGQTVKRFDMGTKPAGYHTINWNANQMAAGVYLYRLQAGDFSSTKKLMIVR
ncbi:MAG: T9SS type A sorting domain-containing protein, partial [bacterium]|nr:T9SS type A sorting domain-containing protein [bacterium]